MKRFLITFSYDGTNFSGYQKQPNERTIQEELEKSLTRLNNDKEVTVHSSGRTDAKVHALNQKAHFDLDIEIEPLNLKKGINSLLPKDIYVKKAEEVSENFHARYNAKGKEYIYLINMGEYNPLERNYVYQYNHRLDVAEMERALKYLEGTHDFKSFTPSNNEEEDYVRTLSQTSIIRDTRDIHKITISLVGTGFMRYQVRNIVGTLVEIGEGKRKSEEMINILNSRDRTKAGKTANPEGLYLRNVFY